MPKTTKHQVIVATWESLNRPSIGANELGILQNALRDRFGAPNVIGPAAIARVLADEGAELRHPQIIEFDANWRKSRIHEKAKRLSSLAHFASAEPVTLEAARTMLDEMEKLRAQFESAEDTDGLEELRSFAADARRQAE